MLNYTGHPLYDIGVATITAFAGKRDPTNLEQSDLEGIADYITKEYVINPLKSFFSVAFTINSGFSNPAFEKKPERKMEYAQKVLRSTHSSNRREFCVFTGEPAAGIVFRNQTDQPPGRAFRQHVPLLTGEDVINFYPYGDAGLPVSGKAMLSIQAFPLGCAKCAGRLLAVHSDNNKLTFHFASRFLIENRRSLQLAHLEGSKKMPEAHFSHRTLLIDTLLDADEMRGDNVEDEMNFSITAYHLSNSGQGAGLDIYHLPLEITSFLRELYTAEYKDSWNKIVRRAWEIPRTKKGGKIEEQEFKPRRNWLYEDIFNLPGGASMFLRTYFLRHALRYARSDRGDPRGEYSISGEAELVSWKITELFLRRILYMDKNRVEQIRSMGDKLAEYISRTNNRRFFYEFYTVQRYDYFRNALIKANLDQVKSGNSPLITLDPYIEVFEEGYELAHPDWKLSRDIVLIRVIERLHEKGWLGRNIDVIQETDEGKNDQN